MRFWRASSRLYEHYQGLAADVANSIFGDRRSRASRLDVSVRVGTFFAADRKSHECDELLWIAEVSSQCWHLDSGWFVLPVKAIFFLRNGHTVCPRIAQLSASQAIKPQIKSRFLLAFLRASQSHRVFHKRSNPLDQCPRLRRAIRAHRRILRSCWMSSWGGCEGRVIAVEVRSAATARALNVVLELLR